MIKRYRKEPRQGQVTRRQFLQTAVVVGGGMIALRGGLFALPGIGVAEAGQGAWTMSQPSSSPSPRAAAALVFDDAREQGVLFGGATFSDASYLPTYLGDTWVWDGQTWEQSQPTVSPSPRIPGAATYDGGRGKVILIGGLDASGQPLNDMWVWNDGTWVELGPSALPPAQVGMSMHYDPLSNSVILLDTSGNTWIWDGITWTSLGTMTVPGPRGGAAIVFDGARKEIVLFGGMAPDGGLLDDTWTWDGQVWSEQMPMTRPVGRSNPVMVYDDASGGVVLFSGQVSSHSSCVSADTCIWDGDNWSPEQSAASPPYRWDASATYDAATNQIVIFGGKTATDQLDDTWIWTD